MIARGAALGQGFDAFAEAFRAETGRDPALTEAAFAEAVSPGHFVAVRTRYGGPAPEPMDDALADYDAQLTTFPAGSPRVRTVSPPPKPPAPRPSAS